MPLILTSAASLSCPHGGRVAVIPKQQKVAIQGGFVLRETDLIGAPIAGCPQAGPGIKPCTTVLAPNPGSSAPTVLVQGLPVLLQTFTALTDGVPPGVVVVQFAGQTLVQANPA
jgi:hypothetical protein